MNIKTTLLAIIIFATAYTGTAQTPADYYRAVSQFQRFYNRQQNDSIFYMFSDHLKEITPYDKTTEMFRKVYGQLGYFVSFSYAFQKDSMRYYSSTFTNTVLTLIVNLNKDNKIETFRFTPKQSDTAQTEKSNFFLKTDNGNIYGTLVTPPGINKVPVVLIIPGSGPTDRNGNNQFGLKGNTYAMLADSLMKQGIASLRYDKRGVGASAAAMIAEDSLTFDDMVNDAIGFTKMLRQHWRFSKVIILGHSEGSLIGIRVAEQEKVAGLISVSGIAQRADKIVEKQLRVESKELSKKAKVLFDSLIDGYTVNVEDPALTPIFRNSVQGYIRTWMKYTPEDEIKKVHAPILILQGTTDIQVDEGEAKKLSKAAPDATLTIIDGMNHLLKQAPEDRALNEATYGNPNLPLSPGLIPAIVQFINATK